jgi:hypothetical protein
MVLPDLQIFILIFNLMLLGESQVINESGGKNRKNPSEDSDLFAAYLINIQT